MTLMNRKLDGVRAQQPARLTRNCTIFKAITLEEVKTMTPAEKDKMHVLWKNAKDSKLARREISRQTPAHKTTTPKGRIDALKGKGK